LGLTTGFDQTGGDRANHGVRAAFDLANLRSIGETGTSAPIMASQPSINIARLTYLLICEAAGIAIALSTRGTMFEVSMATGLLGGLLVAGLFIWIESLIRGFTLRGFSTATFGLAVGLLCAWLLTRVQISSLIELSFRDELEKRENAEALVNALRLALDVTLFASLGFLGAVLALRGNRDDFAFVIPYVRFRQDSSSGQPILLDAESVIDGRITGVMRSGFLHGRLVLPRFSLDELQALAQSPQSDSKQRAQYGLDVLEAMQKSNDIQVSIHDSSLPELPESTHNKLVEIARLLGARLMTSDENLAKIARLRGIDVLNLHELDEALRPPVEVGQRMRIALVKPGKEDHQGVGYLPDGTMIVVNHAVAKIGTSLEVLVVSKLQSAAGLMVFAEPYVRR
jgi:uncharacterized protein YacL